MSQTDDKAKDGQSAEVPQYTEHVGNDKTDSSIGQDDRDEIPSCHQEEAAGTAPPAPPPASPHIVPDDPMPGQSQPETVALNIGEGETQPPPYSSEPPPPYTPYTPAQIKQTIKTAKEQSSGNVDYTRRVFFSLFCGTVCCGLVVAIFLALPTAMVVMGSIYIDDCPGQQYIPIYLIVAGCVGIVKALINLADLIRHKIVERRKLQAGQHVSLASRKPNPADGLLTCFLLVWFFLGCYWIYGVHDDFQSTDPEEDDYCNYTLYYFAFWITSMSFVLLLITCCCFCAVAISMCIIGK